MKLTVGAGLLLLALADFGAGGWTGTARADVRASPARAATGARRTQNASVARAGKRLPTVRKLAGDERRPRLDKRGAHQEAGEADVEIQCVGSSVTSDASASLDSPSRGGINVALGCAATQGSPVAEGSGWALSGTGDANSATGSEGELERVRTELRRAESENLALREEMYGLLGAHVRAEQASKSYVRSVAMLAKSLQQLEQHAQRAQEERLTRESARLGSIHVTRRPDGRLLEEWHDGYQWEQLVREMAALQREEATLKLRHKKAVKRVRALRTVSSLTGERGRAMIERQQSLRCRLRTVKKELEKMQRRREEYKRERKVHQRQLRCHMHQLNSAYLGRAVVNPQGVVLQGRYLLLRLLGRGGFSEVYRALDLLDLRHVACKIHKVEEEWSAARKESFVRMATREFHMHQMMRHPRVVKLLDGTHTHTHTCTCTCTHTHTHTHTVFELGKDAFCTVMEECEGGDLEKVLLSRGSIPEEEARCILRQVLSGLRYAQVSKET